MASTETRKLAAIMFTDIVGFSRQMGVNETRMLRLLGVHNQLIQHAVAGHHGTVIKTVGDAFLVDFPSVVHAVQCAQQIQAQFRTHNADQEVAEQIHVRIGIHLGDIVQRDGDVFGDGVNIASRLQALAEPDTICISDMVYRDVAKKLDLGTGVSLGRPKLKNIAQRFPVYALLSAPPQGVRQRLSVQWLKLSRRVGTAHRVGAVALLLVLVSAGTLVIKSLYFPAPSPGQPQGVAPTISSTPGQSQGVAPMTPPPVLALPDKPSIVVLPFKNMSSDPEQDYFSDGITEDLTSDLSRLSGLFVIARNTAFTYKGKAVNVQEVSKELGVRYVLEGSVRKAGDQVRITAQLIDATTGGHLWSERYDRPLQNIFALQDEIVQKIVTTLKLQLTLREQGILVRKTTDNLEAYDYYLRGVESFYRLTKEANAQARQMFEKALALDPQYAEAYVRLGGTYIAEWLSGWSQDPQNLERAFDLAQRAVALDDTLPLAHSASGFVYLWKQQPDQAIAEAERAIALDPNDANSYAGLANVLSYVGRSEEAIKLLEKAMRLNPRYSAPYLTELGRAYRFTGRYDEAIAALKQSLLRNPNSLANYSQLVNCYLQQWVSQMNQDPQTLQYAFALAQKAIAVSDSWPWSHIALGYVYLWQKRHEQALSEMEQGVALNPNNADLNVFDSYMGLAEVLGYVGRSEEAVKWAEEAVRLAPAYADRFLHNLGFAYYLAGRTEEAITPLKRFLSHYPNRLEAHLTLAVVYSELGREAEAQAEAAEVLRINPQFSLEVHKQRAPYKDSAALERQLAALRQAGLK